MKILIAGSSDSWERRSAACWRLGILCRSSGRTLRPSVDRKGLPSPCQHAAERRSTSPDELLSESSSVPLRSATASRTIVCALTLRKPHSTVKRLKLSNLSLVH